MKCKVVCCYCLSLKFYKSMLLFVIRGLVGTINALFVSEL